MLVEGGLRLVDRSFIKVITKILPAKCRSGLAWWDMFASNRAN